MMCNTRTTNLLRKKEVSRSHFSLDRHRLADLTEDYTLSKKLDRCCQRRSFISNPIDTAAKEFISQASKIKITREGERDFDQTF